MTRWLRAALCGLALLCAAAVAPPAQAQQKQITIARCGTGTLTYFCVFDGNNWVNAFQIDSTAHVVTLLAGGSDGQLQYNHLGAFAGFTMTGDCAVAVPVIACPKSNGITMPVSATSGGVLYYSSSIAAASSGLLAANQIVLGGGAGAAPATTANGTFSGGTLTLGQAGSVIGKLAVVNATSGAITLAPPTGALGAATLTLPDATDQLVGRATTDTLTNKSIDASQLTGAIAAARMPAFTGDITTSAGAVATTLATVNASPGVYGSAAVALGFTVDAKGRMTAVSSTAVNPTQVNGIAYSATAVSGGIPYFSSTSAEASSALLTANALVLGGGAGAAPAPLASLGTTTTLLHGNAAGPPTFAAVSLTADVTGVLPLASGGSGQAFVEIRASGVNFNSGNTDTSLAMALPPGTTRYLVNSCFLSHASGTLTTSTVGIFTAAAGGGTAVVASGTAVTVSTASDGTNNNAMGLNTVNGGSQSYTLAGFPTLFFRVQTPQGSAATADVMCRIVPLA